MSLALGLEDFVALEIPGFILLVCGTLLYNEIVVIHKWGFDENTKDAIAKRKGLGDRAAARQQD